MPYDPAAPRVDHLILFREDVNPRRRKHKPPPPPPPRGSRTAIGTALSNQLTTLERRFPRALKN